MSVVTADEPVDLTTVDFTVKNKFRWDWMQRTAPLNNETYSIGECIRKVNLPGRALCKWCNDVINYGAQGCRALMSHVQSKKHMENGVIMRQTATAAADSDQADSVKVEGKREVRYTILYPSGQTEDEQDFREIDRTVKNRFRLSWLQKIAQVGERRYHFRECIQKVNLPGQAICTWCNDLVSYGSSGAKCLEGHMRTLKHMDNALLVLGTDKADPETELECAEEVQQQAIYSIHIGDPVITDPAPVAAAVGTQFTLTRNDDLDLRMLEGTVKNKFRWDWLDKKASVEVIYSYSDCLKKIDAPGQVLCIWCDQPVDYSATGYKALAEHIKTTKHVNNARFAFQTQSVISSAVAQMEKKGGSSCEAEKYELLSSATAPTAEDEAGFDAGFDAAVLATEVEDEEEDKSAQRKGLIDNDDMRRDTTLPGENSAPGKVTSDPLVVEETTVKEYYRIVKCREFITKKKNKLTGRVLSVSNKKEEEAPVITDQRSPAYHALNNKLPMIPRKKRPASSPSTGVCKKRHLCRPDNAGANSEEETEEVKAEENRGVKLEVSYAASPPPVTVSEFPFSPYQQGITDPARGTCKAQGPEASSESAGADAGLLGMWVESLSGDQLDCGAPPPPGTVNYSQTIIASSFELDDHDIPERNRLPEKASGKLCSGAEKQRSRQTKCKEETGASSSNGNSSESSDYKDDDDDDDGDFINAEDGDDGTNAGQVAEEENEKLSEALQRKQRYEDIKAQAETLKCNKCGAQFSAASSCWRHLLRDNCDEWYECQICGKGFSLQLTLKKHTKRVHFLKSGAKTSSTESHLVQCSDCKRLFASARKHLKHKAKGQCAVDKDASKTSIHKGLEPVG